MEGGELTKPVSLLQTETIELTGDKFATVSLYFSDEVCMFLVGAMEFVWATYSGMKMKEVTNWSPLEQYATEAEAKKIYDALIEKYGKR